MCIFYSVLCIILICMQLSISLLLWLIRCMGFRPTHGEHSHHYYFLFVSLLSHSFLLIVYNILVRHLTVGTDCKCFVELATPKLTQEQIEAIEACCNECIRQRIPIRPKWFHADSTELEQVTTLHKVVLQYHYQMRTRGLPDDVAGLIRVVDIEGEWLHGFMELSCDRMHVS